MHLLTLSAWLTVLETVHALSLYNLTRRVDDGQTYVFNQNAAEFERSCSDLITPKGSMNTISKREFVEQEWAGALELARDANARIEKTASDLAGFNGAKADVTAFFLVDSKDPA